jgi:uncharacterized repeat protein (TIGR03837 family)
MVDASMPRWDIFCKVVDNYGDIGVSWRLARQLAQEKQAEVRLWVDRMQTFAALCPNASADAGRQTIDSVEIRPWPCEFPPIEPADVVIEAFGCELPESYISAMVARKDSQDAKPPVWINLDYLSAEEWVEGCHRLPTLRTRWPLDKYFFFPGFTSSTGGLLRERDLLAQRAAFGAAEENAFWESLGLPPKNDDELRISLFCYQNPSLVELLNHLTESKRPVTLLTTPGTATDQVAVCLQQPLAASPSHSPAPLCRKSLTIYSLPFLSQPDFDRLLWSCDVNFVRGEDSFVRAQWAERPFIWQPYPQTENTHLVKMEAFLQLYLRDFYEPATIRDCWQAWNGESNSQIGMAAAWARFVAHFTAIERHNRLWATRLDQMDDLANNLVSFVRGIYIT